MSLTLGIDPGRKGAFAILDRANMTVETHDMPDTTAGVHSLLMAFPPVAKAIVERPFYNRIIGTKNAGTMGENYGALKGALLWCDIPVVEVAPDKWKSAMGLSSDKAASRAKASQLFPTCADQWARAKDDGRAEAAIIAWWGSQ